MTEQGKGQWYQFSFLGFLPEGEQLGQPGMPDQLSLMNPLLRAFGFAYAADLSVQLVRRPRVEIERKLPADREERVALIGAFVDLLKTVMRANEAPEELTHRVVTHLLTGSPLGDELIDAQAMATPVATVPLADLSFLPEPLRSQGEAIASELGLLVASDPATWCRFCRARPPVPLMHTRNGWQCLDGIDCYGRQSPPDGKEALDAIDQPG